jgi:uncharacterized protein YggE
MAQSRTKAQELANLANVGLGQVVSVSEIINRAASPGLQAEALGIGGGGGPISPGEMEITTQLEVVYSIR